MMSVPTMTPPKLSYAGSDLQATGNGAVGKRRVERVLNDTYQHDSDGKFIIRLKHNMPKEVLDEIGNGRTLVEAVTKLVNKARTGLFRDCKTADERLESAIKYFGTKKGEKWMREQFKPHPIEAPPSLLDNTVRNDPAAAGAPGPAASVTEAGQTDNQTLQLDNEIVTVGTPTPLAHPPRWLAPAINVGTPGLQVPATGQAVQRPMPRADMASQVAPQVAGPAGFGTGAVQHRCGRSDPGLNAICHICGNAHLPLMVAHTGGSVPVGGGAVPQRVPGNDGTLLGKIMKKAKTPTAMVVASLAGLAYLVWICILGVSFARSARLV